jgi:hypothetical protein
VLGVFGFGGVRLLGGMYLGIPMILGRRGGRYESQEVVKRSKDDDGMNDERNPSSLEWEIG